MSQDFMAAGKMLAAEKNISLEKIMEAIKAASFVRLSRSAPLKPGVPLATFSRSTPLSNLICLEWIFKISNLLFKSGNGISIILSKLCKTSTACAILL